MSRAISLKQILGTPFVPSGRLTRRAVRLRARILRAHRGMAPPAIRVLEGLFGLFDNRVLGLLVELGIPDLLSEPRTATELASRTDTEQQRLERVLRYAAGRGFVDEDKAHRFRANAVTEVLRRDHPNSWRGWVEFASSDWFWGAWAAMEASVRPSDTTGMEAANGAPFFEYVTEKRPDAGDAFDRAMEAGATMQGLALAHALEWGGVATVCDVGGGTGAALRSLLREHGHLQGTLFDLPEVVAKAPQRERLAVVPGDFFSSAPAGCDRYLLLAVIHDWDDAEATTILQNVARAMSADSRALVVENELPETATGDFVEASDLLMLVLGPGRERTRAGFERLFAHSGLLLEKVHVLPTGFSAFELSVESPAADA